MKILKCSICWICLIVLCLYAFPLSNYVLAESYYMGGVTWHVEDGCATITGTGSIADNTCPWGLEKDSITEVIIDAGVIGIGKGVFQGFDNLTKVTIREGLTYIDDSAFRSCSKLESIALPASIKSIGSYAFEGCSRLKTVHIADIAAWCAVAQENYSSSPFTNGADLYLDGQLVTDLVIPEGCANVSPYAFKGCRSLETVYFSNDVREIQKFAFYRCSNLKRISLPGSLTMIGYHAFNDCMQLRTVTYRGRISQLKKLHIDASEEDRLLQASWQLDIGYTILFTTLLHLLGVGIPVGFLFLILFIRRKRRGY